MFNASALIGNDRLAVYPGIAPLKGPKGHQLWNKMRGTNLKIAGTVITKKCKSPETLVRWYDYINSTLDILLLWDVGPENLAWAYTPDKKWETIMTNVPAGTAWGEIRHTYGVGGSGPQCGEIYEYNVPSVRALDSLAISILDVMALQTPFYPKQTIPVGLEEASVIQERSTLFIDIDNYVRNFTAMSVLNGLTDAQWNEHLRNIDKLNIPRYIQSYQTLFNRF